MNKSSQGTGEFAQRTQRLGIILVAFLVLFGFFLLAARVYRGAQDSQTLWERQRIERAQRAEHIQTLQRELQATREAREP